MSTCSSSTMLISSGVGCLGSLSGMVAVSGAVMVAVLKEFLGEGVHVAGWHTHPAAIAADRPGKFAAGDHASQRSRRHAQTTSGLTDREQFRLHVDLFLWGKVQDRSSITPMSVAVE